MNRPRYWQEDHYPDSARFEARGHSDARMQRGDLTDDSAQWQAADPQDALDHREDVHAHDAQHWVEIERDRRFGYRQNSYNDAPIGVRSRWVQPAANYRHKQVPRSSYSGPEPGRGYGSSSGYAASGGYGSARRQPQLRYRRAEHDFDSPYAPGMEMHDVGYHGMGPKNYTRSDERIREDLCERLYDAWDVDASQLEVNVRNGVATLTGTVWERAMKHRAEDMAEAVPGVREVENQLRVAPRGTTATVKDDTMAETRTNTARASTRTN